MFAKKTNGRIGTAGVKQHGGIDMKPVEKIDDVNFIVEKKQENSSSALRPLKEKKKKLKFHRE